MAWPSRYCVSQRTPAEGVVIGAVNGIASAKPEGIEGSLWRLYPSKALLPSVLTPQAKSPPEVTRMNAYGGGSTRRCSTHRLQIGRESLDSGIIGVISFAPPSRMRGGHRYTV